jgi:hypothetical protein
MHFNILRRGSAIHADPQSQQAHTDARGMNECSSRGWPLLGCNGPGMRGVRHDVEHGAISSFSDAPVEWKAYSILHTVCGRSVRGYPMQRLGRAASLFATLGALLVFIAQAAQAAEPLEGTWMLQVEKSVFGAVPGPKGQLRTYAIADGLETMTARGINSEGNPTKVTYAARYDGREYRIAGSGGGDVICLRRIDALTTQSTEKRGGKVTITALRRVSPDGRTLTVETKGTLPDGRLLSATMVFEKR